ncbi:hypothetical protein LEMLEM_LOCUS17601, partial [Lemmus lemmus]
MLLEPILRFQSHEPFLVHPVCFLLMVEDQCLAQSSSDSLPL